MSHGEVDPATGMVVDFAEIAAAFGPLHDELDHRYLNEIEGLENPTSENVARWIWRRLEGRLALCRVVVSETCTSGVEYVGSDDTWSDISKLSSLGSPTRYRYEDPTAEMLEVFDNSQTAAAWIVELDCLEFTSLCPMTGQPDFGRIRIHYIPDRLCVESKSLKLYLGAYRNHGAFHEDCVNRIAGDLESVIEPRLLRVFGDFNSRGGIAIRPLALRIAEGMAAEERAACFELLAQHDSTARRP